MVNESYPHADAEVVRRVRQAFGSEIRIVVVHGRIWTGVAMLIRNGAFDYYTGGDLVGVPLNGQRVT